ncbi:hypothetical protein [Aeromicrobium sp.]
MISRRALFGTGAGVVVLAGVATYGGRDHRLDDVAREVGIEPRRLTAESDERLIKRVQKDQSVLLAWTEAVAAGHSGPAKALAPLIANLKTQLGVLGGVQAGIDIGTPPAAAPAALDSVIIRHERAAAKRAKDSLEAVSGDFAQVLASISVSLSQNVVVLRNARKAIA